MGYYYYALNHLPNIYVIFLSIYRYLTSIVLNVLYSYHLLILLSRIYQHYLLKFRVSKFPRIRTDDLRSLFSYWLRELDAIGSSLAL